MFFVGSHQFDRGVAELDLVVALIGGVPVAALVPAAGRRCVSGGCCSSTRSGSRYGAGPSWWRRRPRGRSGGGAGRVRAGAGRLGDSLLLQFTGYRVWLPVCAVGVFAVLLGVSVAGCLVRCRRAGTAPGAAGGRGRCSRGRSSWSPGDPSTGTPRGRSAGWPASLAHASRAAAAGGGTRPGSWPGGGSWLGRRRWPGSARPWSWASASSSSGRSSPPSSPDPQHPRHLPGPGRARYCHCVPVRAGGRGGRRTGRVPDLIGPMAAQPGQSWYLGAAAQAAQVRWLLDVGLLGIAALAAAGALGAAGVFIEQAQALGPLALYNLAVAVVGVVGSGVAALLGGLMVNLGKGAGYRPACSAPGSAWWPSPPWPWRGRADAPRRRMPPRGRPGPTDGTARTCAPGGGRRRARPPPETREGRCRCRVRGSVHAAAPAR